MADPITLTMMALTAAGGITSAAGTIMGGEAADESAEFKAQQLEQQAGESRAAGQAQANERRRNARLVLSSLRAKAAAFAGDASDPGIVKLEGDIAGRGEYQALSEMWIGENRARGLEDAAMGARAEGDAAKKASRLAAIGTVLSAAGSMAKTYGGPRLDRPPVNR